MSLPKLKHPLFELTLPSSGQKIEFRPFLVKEEKILLIAKESGDQGRIMSAVKQIISNCIIGDEVNIDAMPSFDIEYFFIKLRSVSVNNVMDIQITDSDTKEIILTEINLDEVEVVKSDNHTNHIKLEDNLSITLNYPTYQVLQRYASNKEDERSEFELIKDSINIVYVGDNPVKFQDEPINEQTDFLESLHIEHWKKIQEFFETMPKLKHEIKYINKEGTEKTISLEGISDFFV